MKTRRPSKHARTEAVGQWIADQKALEPPALPKKEELKKIEREINSAYRRIGRRHEVATKLMAGAIYEAKRIGDLLLRVKTLVGHGNYQTWAAVKA